MATLLWNLQTQRAEYVELEDVKGKLASGAYREYEGSEVTVDSGGAEGAYSPSEGAAKERLGAPLTSPGPRNAKARKTAQEEAVDTVGDKAARVADGFIKGLSGGGVGLPKGGHREKASREVNSHWEGVGELASIATVVLFPGSAAGRFTPLGAANHFQNGISKIVKGKSTSLIRGGIAEGVGGAAAGVALATGASALRTVTGNKPLSPDAIVDDIGLNLAVGGGLGLVGGGLGKMASKIKDARKEVDIAARFDEYAGDAHAALADTASSWNTAHLGAKARLATLQDHVKLGALDSADMPGAEWIAARQTAADEADKALKTLYKVAGTDDMALVGQRMRAVIENGKASDLRIAKALDDYGNAVSRLDDAMLPNGVDDAHFGGLIHKFGEELDNIHLDIEKPAMDADAAAADAVGRADTAPHGRPAPRTPRKERQAPAGIDRPDEYGENLLKEMEDWQRAGARAEQVDTPSTLAATPPRGIKVQPDAPAPAPADGGKKPWGPDLGGEPLPAGYVDSGPLDRGTFRPRGEELAEAAGVKIVNKVKPSGRENTARIARADAPLELAPDVPMSVNRDPTPAQGHKLPELELADTPVARSRVNKDVDLDLGEMYKPKAQDGAPTPIDDVAPDWTRPSEIKPRGATTSPAAKARAARDLLEQHKAFARPLRTTELGHNIQAAMQKLQEATGGRLGSEESQKLAQKLGVNLQKYSGPVASKVVDLWAIRKLAAGIAEEAASAGGKPGILSHALRGGMIGKSAEMGGRFGGRFGAAAAGYAMAGTLGAAGVLAASSGRFKNSAILGMARVLSPTGRKAIALGVAERALLTSYDAEEPPTRDYAKKAAQLARLADNPEYLENNVRAQLKDIEGLAPEVVQGVVETSRRRVENLRARIPAGSYRGPFEPAGPPDQGALDEFHQYESITADKRLVFDYIKSGFVPPIVVDAMNEQHGEYMRDLRTYVLEHPDEVQKAPHATKVALSQLLGVYLVQEADPAYVQRQQEAYKEAKQEAAMKKQMKQGAAAIKGGIQPTPGQMMMAPIPGM